MTLDHPSVRPAGWVVSLEHFLSVPQVPSPADTKGFEDFVCCNVHRERYDGSEARTALCVQPCFGSLRASRLCGLDSDLQLESSSSISAGRVAAGRNSGLGISHGIDTSARKRARDRCDLSSRGARELRRWRKALFSVASYPPTVRQQAISSTRDNQLKEKTLSCALGSKTT